MAFQYSKSVYKKDENRCFGGGNGFKIKEAWFGLDIRKNFLTEEVKHCHRLPREMGVPSLRTFKIKLNVALCNLIEIKCAPVLHRKVRLPLNVSSSPNFLGVCESINFQK